MSNKSIFHSVSIAMVVTKWSIWSIWYEKLFHFFFVMKKKPTIHIFSIWIDVWLHAFLTRKCECRSVAVSVLNSFFLLLLLYELSRSDVEFLCSMPNLIFFFLSFVLLLFQFFICISTQYVFFSLLFHLFIVFFFFVH